MTILTTVKHRQFQEPNQFASYCQLAYSSIIITYHRAKNLLTDYYQVSLS